MTAGSKRGGFWGSLGWAAVFAVALAVVAHPAEQPATEPREQPAPEQRKPRGRSPVKAWARRGFVAMGLLAGVVAGIGALYAQVPQERVYLEKLVEDPYWRFYRPRGVPAPTPEQLAALRDRFPDATSDPVLVDFYEEFPGGTEAPPTKTRVCRCWAITMEPTEPEEMHPEWIVQFLDYKNEAPVLSVTWFDRDGRQWGYAHWVSGYRNGD